MREPISVTGHFIPSTDPAVEEGWRLLWDDLFRRAGEYLALGGDTGTVDNDQPDKIAPGSSSDLRTVVGKTLDSNPLVDYK